MSTQIETVDQYEFRGSVPSFFRSFLKIGPCDFIEKSFSTNLRHVVPIYKEAFEIEFV